MTFSALWPRAVMGGSCSAAGAAWKRSFSAAVCLDGLNTWLFVHADPTGLVSRWHGARLFAGDAIALMPAIQR